MQLGRMVNLFIKVSAVSFCLHFLVVGNSLAAVQLAEFVQGRGSLEADLSINARYEYWDWFTRQGQVQDNSYDYSFVRSRLGFSLALPSIKAYVQAQDTRMWGLPGDSIGAPPAGPLGIGAIYYLHGGQRDYHSTVIRQAYLEIPGLFQDRVSAKVGRFDYIDGLEVAYKNPKVMWLKKIRLAERLIGPFGWSSFGRSFDGIELALDTKPFNLTGTLTHPTQGGFENNAHRTIDDIDLATLTATFKYDRLLPGMEERLFYFYYEDDRDIAKVDNSGGISGAVKIHTAGLHLLKTLKVEQGVFDGLFWGAYQNGDWGTLDHRAWAAAVEGGFHFTGLAWKPWLRAGYFVSSGDDDPGDGEHGTFYQLLPTARKYALFPFYNLMNNEDLFAQLIVKPHARVAVRADLHFLSLREKNDRWYMGAGPTMEEGAVFGYIGRPSFGDRDLATVVDLVGMITLSDNISGTLYYGHVFGDEVVENVYNDQEDADFFYLELAFTF